MDKILNWDPQEDEKRKEKERKEREDRERAERERREREKNKAREERPEDLDFENMLSSLVIFFFFAAMHTWHVIFA